LTKDEKGAPSRIIRRWKRFVIARYCQWKAFPLSKMKKKTNSFLQLMSSK